MDPQAMTPQGAAMFAYLDGDTQAQLHIHRDDGMDDVLPVSYFFRESGEFDAVDATALEKCSGHVLDVGAGAGAHSLVLQQRGLTVTAIDIIPQAVEIMTRRGVNVAVCADVFSFDGGSFDTILMLGHGIGLVETITGLDRFLNRAGDFFLAKAGGQILLDSQDVRVTDDPRHLAYHVANQLAGRYLGEVRLQLSFGGQVGPLCGWLHVDSETLGAHAEAAGWNSKVLLQKENGHYLAQLVRQPR